jgi:hypothetical protein
VIVFPCFVEKISLVIVILSMKKDVRDPSCVCFLIFEHPSVRFDFRIGTLPFPRLTERKGSMSKMESIYPGRGAPLRGPGSKKSFVGNFHVKGSVYATG